MAAPAQWAPAQQQQQQQSKQARPTIVLLRIQLAHTMHASRRYPAHNLHQTYPVTAEYLAKGTLHTAARQLNGIKVNAE
jgi:hypothetical protein